MRINRNQAYTLRTLMKENETVEIFPLDDNIQIFTTLEKDIQMMFVINKQGELIESNFAG